MHSLFEHAEIWWVLGLTAYVPLAVYLRGLPKRKKLEDRLRAQSAVLEEMVQERAAQLVKAEENLEKAARYAAELEEGRKVLQQQAQALSRANEEARAASVAKSQFLANMSHEIRTPLTSILGFAELMATGSLSPAEAHSSLESIIRNGSHLLQILNDILDLSKIEAGKLTAEKGDCALQPLLVEVEALLSLKAKEKGIAFRVDCCYPLPKTIQTDATRLKQILLNLGSNGVKFTDKGFVALRVRYDSARRMLSLEVEDTGEGIREQDLANLFQPFYQADGRASRRHGGAGLGLSISRRLAELLNGEIKAASTPGAGSTFTLELKLGENEVGELLEREVSAPAKASAAVRSEPRLQGRVLLAEDSADNMHLISYLLKKTGVEIVVAANGEEAVMRALAEKIDLVLMDIQMPVLDGYQATSALRQSGFKRPIIALTANAMKTDVEKAREVGCDDHLGKPFKPEELFSLLRRYLTGNGVELNETDWVSQLDTEGDEEVLRVVRGFIAGLPTRVAELGKYLAAADWDAMRKEAHKLRSAELFGFARISELAAELERASATLDEQSAMRLLDLMARISSRAQIGTGEASTRSAKQIV